MSIKAMKKIPQNLVEKRQSYREMIRKDIQEAIDNHIEKFEFEGDYNWRYLANYAREEADMIWRKDYLYPASKEARAILKKERPEETYFAMPSAFEMKGKFIKISSVKGEDRPHVYGTIDYGFLEGLVERLLEQTRENEKRIAEKKEIRRRQQETKKE